MKSVEPSAPPIPYATRSGPSRRFGMFGLATLVGLAVVGVAGCGDQEALEPVTCHEIVASAAQEREVDDEVAGLDLAIQRCGSYQQLVDELAQQPQMMGYSPQVFLERRCTAEETLATTEVCLVAAPPTTIAEVDPNPEYTGETLDGRLITVTNKEVKFEGSVPAIIANTVRLAENEGCVAVLGARDDFAVFVKPGRKGDIASMYAQHAQSVADFVGCANTPIVVGPGGTVGTGPPPSPPTTDG